MGYSTEFRGTLTFKQEATASQLAELKKYLEKDVRDIYGIPYNRMPQELFKDGKYGSGWCHIDLELTDDFSALQWNGAEKTYELEHIVNWLTDKMREKYPDFALEGKLTAQGEDMEDRWELVMQDGFAVKRPLVVVGQRITCPRCEESFILEEAANAG